MQKRGTYNIWTIGCQMNEADSRHLASQLEALGYTPTPKTADADLIVINTCVVRQQAEDKIYTRLRFLEQLKHKRPDLLIAIMGCLVGTKPNPELNSRFPFVDVFMPPSDTRPLLQHLRGRDNTEVARAHQNQERAFLDAVQDEELRLPINEQGESVTAYVPVVLGCSHACSFCIIPYRRGAERSRSQSDIIKEVRALADQGVKEITLLGQIVDRYGLDLEKETTLSSLLSDVAKVEGILRVRFLTSHPNWFTEELMKTVADTPKICPHIEIPVQAGNDRILDLMKRGYTADDYRRKIEQIRAHIPNAGISTDIIVGFPGETDEEFMDTYRLMDELDLDMIRIAKYSERPQTLAERRYPDNVDAEEKERRRLELDALLNTKLKKKHQPLKGSTVEILVEERGRNNRWRGRTPQGKLVFIDDDRNLKGQLVNITLDWTGAFSMLGHVNDRQPAEVTS